MGHALFFRPAAPATIGSAIFAMGSDQGGCTTCAHGCKCRAVDVCMSLSVYAYVCHVCTSGGNYVHDWYVFVKLVLKSIIMDFCHQLL